jgi:rhomboid family GlyGly-CTERM serine protease
MVNQPQFIPSPIGRLPIVTIALSATTIAMFMCAGCRDLFAYDRASIACGEAWRLVTGHLTHWSADHLGWDLVMFAGLGAMIEGRGRWGLVRTLLLSAIAISAALWLWRPDVQQYRGLSGIDSALFTFIAVSLLCEARQAKRAINAWVLAALIFGFVAKIGYELTTGATLFVDSSSAGFTPLPLVHAVGGVSGAIAGVFDAIGTPSQVAGAKVVTASLT